MESRSTLKMKLNPLRRVFGWNKAETSAQSSFGPETATPRKSNTRNKHDSIIGKQITIKDTENVDPNVATSHLIKQKDVATGLERRRIRWKKGLELTNIIEHKSDHKLKGNIAEFTKKDGFRCHVYYEGIPRGFVFPIGDGAWPCGWCQREIVWMFHGNRKSCDVVWFTPLCKKPLHSIQQVDLFSTLLPMYGGDEHKAYSHLVALTGNSQPIPIKIH